MKDDCGLNVFPIVPDDIKEWEEQRLGIYKKMEVQVKSIGIK